MQQIAVGQLAYSIGREVRKFCKSRLTLVAAFFTSFYLPVYGPLEISVFDATEIQTLVMPSGRRQRAVTEPLQADDAITRSEHASLVAALTSPLGRRQMLRAICTHLSRLE